MTLHHSYVDLLQHIASRTRRSQQRRLAQCMDRCSSNAWVMGHHRPGLDRTPASRYIAYLWASPITQKRTVRS